MLNLGLTGLIIIAICCVGIVATIAIVGAIVLLTQRRRTPEDSAQVIDIDYEDIPG
ncbi:MAG: hypothetical protein U9R58_00130 [Chloroflexota bacterium]|nr:hypothetical protein [Chloroflexota bacterium]